MGSVGLHSLTSLMSLAIRAQCFRVRVFCTSSDIKSNLLTVLQAKLDSRAQNIPRDSNCGGSKQSV